MEPQPAIEMLRMTGDGVRKPDVNKSVVLQTTSQPHTQSTAAYDISLGEQHRRVGVGQWSAGVEFKKPATCYAQAERFGLLLHFIAILWLDLHS
jgi:hypothetical protein|eukprot:COSAG02_NODE_3844_length_6158_cov_3.953458_2_plen_94_part_00